MKLYIFSILLLTQLVNIAAQSTWQHYSSKLNFPHSQYSDVLTFDDDNIVIAETLYESQSRSAPKLTLLNSEGQTLIERTLDYRDVADTTILHHNAVRFIRVDEDNYILISAIAVADTSYTYIVFEQFDKELNMVKEHFVHAVEGDIGLIYPTFLENTILVNIHLKNKINAGPNGIYAYQTVLFDLEGNILKEKIHEVTSGALTPFSMQERLDSAGYLGIGNAFKTYFYDEDLNYTRFYEADFSRTSTNANVFKKFNDSLYILSSGINDNGNIQRSQLALTLVDTNGDLYDQVIYADTDPNHSTVRYNSLSVQNGNFYTSGRSVSISPFTTKTIIASIDSSFNINWVSVLERPEGIEAISIAASPDGGVVIVGYQIIEKADFPSQIEHFIIKLDDRGRLMTNTQGVVQASLVTYPNPTTDILNIELGGAECDDCSVTVFDIDGREVLQSTDFLNNQIQLNVAILPTGSYTYRVLSQSSVLASDKWIKI